ncbi:hypothetical protein [Salidesulfovibrio onnuriiensis]|uniref:hypothetical protein n=1 Tax=Salidesulfovibrio onnuriiensis TaxID=2583823 RepID=UPI0011C8F6E6|nr:hypothetical protein [Salidesulfovibrio onnuriiensis]
MSTEQELDILEMPFEGLAAYWLSIKKILDGRKGKTIIKDEIAGTQESYIRHLLETVFSKMDLALVRRLAEVKRDTLLDDYRRKIDLMRLALFAVASRENPRVTLVRMDSKFAHAPMSEKKAFDMAQGLMDAVQEKGADRATLLAVDHKMPFDRLVVKLLFYVMYARPDKHRLDGLLRYTKSRYFTEGLSLAIDNFEPDFLAYHLEGIRDQTMAETLRKMDMSLEMAVGIRDKLPYDDIFKIARAYMPS